jgi:ATP-dependent Clp protease protease subunit
MPLRSAPVWALLGPTSPRPESWGVRTDVTNLATAGVAKLYLYGEIGYWGVEASDVIDALSNLTGPVEVHINSMGGSVFEGLAIYQALVEYPHAVNVVIDGLAASAASFIAMAGNMIEIGPAAHMMIHNASAYCMGDADDHEATALMLRNCTAAIAGLYAKRTGGDVQDFIAAMSAETWYVGQEAVDAGLADKVRGEEDEEIELPAPAGNTHVETVVNLDKLPDPPVMRRDDGPDSQQEEDQRERPIETDGNTPKNSSPGEDEVNDLWEQLDPGGRMLAWFENDQPAGLFDHLAKGAAQ